MGTARVRYLCGILVFLDCFGGATLDGPTKGEAANAKVPAAKQRIENL